MASSKKQPRPLSPEAREKLWGAIQSTQEPLPAAKLVKLLSEADRIREVDAIPVLEEAVSMGHLFRYPPKTARGKPLYWDRDATVIVRRLVSEASRQSEAPFTARELLKRIKPPVKLKPEEIIPLLDEDVQNGTLFAFPPATAKSPPRYWHRDLIDFGRREAVRWIEAKGPQTQANLKRSLKGFKPDQIQEVLEQCIAAGELKRHPAIGKVKKELFGTRPPSPLPYLKEVGTLLSKLVPQLRQAEIGEAEIRHALIELIEEAGITFTTTTKNTKSSPALSGPDLSAGTTNLIDLMRQIKPGADRGALVGARDLRRAAKMGKEEFDEAVLDLARQQKFSLHRHDYPVSLSEQERDEMVTDGQGNYYVGIALRRAENVSTR